MNFIFVLLPVIVFLLFLFFLENFKLVIKKTYALYCMGHSKHTYKKGTNHVFAQGLRKIPSPATNKIFLLSLHEFVKSLTYR